MTRAIALIGFVALTLAQIVAMGAFLFTCTMALAFAIGAI